MSYGISTFIYQTVAMNKFYHLLLYIVGYLGYLNSHFEQKPIEIITVSYNNIRWVKRNLESMINQDYDNYHITYIDDKSTDGTADYVEKFIARNNLHYKIHLIRLC